MPSHAALAAPILLLSLLARPISAQDDKTAGGLDPCAGCPKAQQKLARFTDDSNDVYIDSAIVGTALRFRFDAGYDFNRPDRAEFFYGKCLCFIQAFGQDAVSPGPARKLDYAEGELAVEYAVAPRLSLFLEAPFRSIDLTDTNGAEQENHGLGDLHIGFKWAIHPSENHYLTLQLRQYFPSGEGERGLGNGHASIEPALLFWSRPASRLTLESEARWWHPLGGSSDPFTGGAAKMIRKEPPLGSDAEVQNHDFAGEVFRFGSGLSYTIGGPSLRLAPVAELVGWYVASGYVMTPNGPEDASGDTIVNLKLGARLGISEHDSLAFGYGFALTDTEWYGKILRFEFRHSF